MASRRGLIYVGLARRSCGCDVNMLEFNCSYGELPRAYCLVRRLRHVLHSWATAAATAGFLLGPVGCFCLCDMSSLEDA